MRLEVRLLVLACAVVSACDNAKASRRGDGGAGREPMPAAGGDAGVGGDAGGGAPTEVPAGLRLEILRPADGDIVFGTVTVATSIEGVLGGIRSQTATVDGDTEVDLDETTHSAEWSSCDASEGEHRLVAEASDQSLATARDEVMFVVDNASVAPVLRGQASVEENRLDWEHCGRFEGYRVFWGTEPGIDGSSDAFDSASRSALHEPERGADRYYYRVAPLLGDRVGELSNELVLTRGEAPRERAEALCSSDGWCWDNGAPQGQDLAHVWSHSNHDVVASGLGVTVRWDGVGWSQLGEPLIGINVAWGATPDDLWVAGSRMRHWDGARLSVVEELPNSWFDSVWGTSAQNVWIYGSEGVFHFGGAEWVKLPTETLNRYHPAEIWATGGDDIWTAGNGMMGEDGTLLHFDGSVWTVVHTGEPWLTAVWGSATADVWSVGRLGTLLHFDGDGWQRVESGTIEQLNDVHGCGANEVWAVGTHGTVLHFDGEEWTDRSPRTTLDLQGVWCNDEGTTWVVGERGETLRWDGAWSRGSTERLGPLRSVAALGEGLLVTGEYETVLRRDADGWHRLQGTVAGEYPNVTLRGLHGTSPEDVWAVGDSGVTLHFDGDAWQVFPSIASYDLHAVWALAPDDVWAGGEKGTLLRYDGQRWTGWTGRDDVPYIKGLWGAGSDDVWAVGWETMLHFDGQSWSDALPEGLQLEGVFDGIWGFASNDVYATTTHGSIIRWDGDDWSSYDPGVPVSVFLVGIHGSAEDDFWILGTDYSLHRNENGWTRTEEDFGGWSPLGVWSRAPDDVFVPRHGTVSHFDGDEWTEATLPSVRPAVNVRGVADQVYAVGEYGTLFKHDGDAWQRELPAPVEPQHLGSTWVESPTSFWVVGDYGTIRYYDGETWKTHESGTTAQLFAVAGVSGDDIWAAGEAGTMLHYDGESWRHFNSGTTLDINGLWAEPGGTVVAVAGTFVDGWIIYDGTVLRWTGGSWAPDPAPNVPTLTDVWGASPDDIWAVGDTTTIHFDGYAWTEVPLELPAPTLLAVWGESATSIWAVGAAGAIQHFDGSAWRPQATPGVSHLLAVGGTSEAVWAVGDNGAIWRRALE